MNHIQQGSREYRRAAAKYLQEENARWPEHLRLWPREEWPDGPMRASKSLLSVYRSRTYLVQVFNEAAPVLVRLSVNRTAITPKGGWQQDIPWEDLQRLKREAGYGEFDAVEVYPSDRDVVNVANMRHLWIMAQPLAFKWTSAQGRE